MPIRRAIAKEMESSCLLGTVAAVAATERLTMARSGELSNEI